MGDKKVIKKSKRVCLLLVVLLVSLQGCQSIRDWWALDEYETFVPPAHSPGDSFAKIISDWWDTSWYSQPIEPVSETTDAWSAWWEEDVPAVKPSYTAVLTHADNQFILDYSGTRKGEPYRDRLIAPTSEDLISEMQNNPAVFTKSAIKAVRTQSRLIPADNLKEGEIAEIKRMLNDYYTDPSEEHLNVLVKTYHKYNTTKGAAGRAIAEAFYNAVLKISPKTAPFLLEREYSLQR